MSSDHTPVVKHKDVALQPVDAARGTRMAVLLGPDEGAPGFVMRRFVIEPGGAIPAHRHPDIEHEQVVEHGEMLLVLDGAEHTVRGGDSILIPAGTSHRYENRADRDVSFICVIPRTDSYHTEWLEPPENSP